MSFAEAIRNGELVLTAECSPPRGADAAKPKTCASALAKAVHAVSVPESEDGARLSSLAACGLIADAGAEPIVHLLTRDMNRIALQSAILGAASLGVRNVLCLAGRHQALTASASARGVFDIDPVQLLRVADTMRREGKLADGQELDAPVELTLGTDTNPFADPVDLQVMALDKAVTAGADFVITQPVFNLDRISVWMTYVRERGIHTRTCIIAGIMPVTSTQQAVSLAEKYCHLDIRDEIVERLDTASDKRAAGVHLAAETIAYVKKIEGIRGIHLMTGDDPELAAEVLAASGLAGS